MIALAIQLLWILNRNYSVGWRDMVVAVRNQRVCLRNPGATGKRNLVRLFSVGGYSRAVAVRGRWQRIALSKIRIANRHRHHLFVEDANGCLAT